MRLIAFTILWGIYFLINKVFLNTNDKINYNFLSFTHSIGATIISYSLNSKEIDSNSQLLKNTNINYLIDPELVKNILFYFSASYFIWDTAQIIIKRNWGNWVYIYHHSICLYMLYQLKHSINLYIIIDILHIGELSNFFNYIVYYLIKANYKNNIIIPFKIIQLLWFAYFRVYIMTGILLNYFPIFENRIFAYILSSIYFMGLLWGWGQFNILYKDIKTLLIKDN